MPISKKVLKEIRFGNLFIETGTDKGECIQRALDVGFERAISIELNRTLFLNAKRRFAACPYVRLLCGSSPAVLRQVLPSVLEPCTFWLDAHPDHDSPVLHELSVIAEHGIKNHRILIDDRRLMHGHWKSVTEDQVIDKIKRINPKYRISHVDGVSAGDIIMATL